MESENTAPFALGYVANVSVIVLPRLWGQPEGVLELALPMSVGPHVEAHRQPTEKRGHGSAQSDTEKFAERARGKTSRECTPRLRARESAEREIAEILEDHIDLLSMRHETAQSRGTRSRARNS